MGDPWWSTGTKSVTIELWHQWHDALPSNWIWILLLLPQSWLSGKNPLRHELIRSQNLQFSTWIHMDLLFLKREGRSGMRYLWYLLQTIHRNWYWYSQKFPQTSKFIKIQVQELENTLHAVGNLSNVHAQRIALRKIWDPSPKFFIRLGLLLEQLWHGVVLSRAGRCNTTKWLTSTPCSFDGAYGA